MQGAQDGEGNTCLSSGTGAESSRFGAQCMRSN